MLIISAKHEVIWILSYLNQVSYQINMETSSRSPSQVHQLYLIFALAACHVQSIGNIQLFVLKAFPKGGLLIDLSLRHAVELVAVGCMAVD